ncbi:hypothetical protein ABID23_000725 [Bartonella silvatica]|uniref:Uncharacterized protein n=1 Tax=Bartonella silvatica TaxID=357760 RepID=A0ABV2HGG8_9HYPH
MSKLMNIRYYFVICVITLCVITFSFLSMVKIFAHAVFQEKTSIVVPVVSTINMFLDKRADSLLNKVIIPSHPGNSEMFWNNVGGVFQKVIDVYTNLLSYLYTSLFFIFSW